MRDPMRTALTVWALCLGALSIGALLPSAAAAQASDQTESVRPAPDVVTQFAGWVTASGDSHGLPFVIIDKVGADVAVFGADGQLKGAAPALIGLARGDDSVPGIGERKLSSIRPDERTTPAGRFLASFGRGPKNASVLWVDYDTAISMHPVVTTNPKEHRLQRLETPTPEDNRITFGCINLPAAFYEDLVRPTFTGTSGVVYILPETRPLAEVFPAFRTQTADTPPAPDIASTHDEALGHAPS